MAEKKTVKRKTKTQTKNTQLAEFKDEIQDLRVEIENLRLDIEKLLPKPTGKRIAHHIFVGILRGFGLVIGTTIIAGAVFFILRQAISSPAAQSWIENSVQSIVETVTPPGTTDEAF